METVAEVPKSINGSPWLRRANGLMILAVVAIQFVNIRFAEKLPVNEGLGWDGRIYGRLAAEFPGAIAKRTLDPYYSRRTLPSMLVHYGLRLYGKEMTPGRIVRAFGWLNLLGLALVAFAWGRISDDLRLAPSGKWLGWMSLFMNFSVLKHNAYYPVLTDTTAMAIASLMVLAYLRRWSAALPALSVIGFFTWPTLVWTGLSLFVLETWPVLPVPQRSRRSVWLAAAAALAVTAMAADVHYRIGYRHDGAPVWEQWVPVSLAMLGAYLFLALRPLAETALAIARQFPASRAFAVRIMISAVLIMSCGALADGIATENPSEIFSEGLARVVLATGIKKPGVFLLGHIIWFGPGLLLALFGWEACCREASCRGAGFPIILSGGLLLAGAAESRYLTTLLPFFVPFIVLEVERRRLPMSFYAAFSAVSLAFSKVWLQINPGVDHSSNAYMQFPWQKFFGNVGYFMGDSMYLAQAATVLVVALWLYLSYWRGTARPAR